MDNYVIRMDTYSQRVTDSVVAAVSESGHTLNALADGTGIARNTLRRRLNGASPFTTRELELLARFLEVDVLELAAANAA